MRSTRLLVPALAPLLVSSCVALAGAGVGYVVSQEVLPNSVHEAQVIGDVDVVYASARETTEILHDVGTQVYATDMDHQIRATIDGARVVIAIEAHDIDRTWIRVTAEKFLGADAATAERVTNEVIRRLDEAPRPLQAGYPPK